jgi:Mg2+ and Co2+ transporter CorA
VQDVINELAKENSYWYVQSEHKDNLNDIFLFEGKNKLSEKGDVMNRETDEIDKNFADEKMEIYRRISETEKKLDIALINLKNELSNKIQLASKERLNSIDKEIIEELNKITSDIKQVALEQQRKREEKKGFFTKILHSRRLF